MKQDVILGCGYVGLAWAKLRGASGLTVTTTNPDRLPELSPLADRVVVIQGNDSAGLKPSSPMPIGSSSASEPSAASPTRNPI
jgi:threonine dehydrogenase-like Zn-dependent dehydrogenase